MWRPDSFVVVALSTNSEKRSLKVHNHPDKQAQEQPVYSHLHLQRDSFWVFACFLFGLVPVSNLFDLVHSTNTKISCFI